MKKKLNRTKSILFRGFLIYCILYTILSLLFDVDSVDYAGISETACPSILISATTEAELTQQLVEQFTPTFVFSVGEPADLHREVIVPYQIVRDPATMDRYVLRGAVVYPLDYGGSSVGIRLSIGPNRYSISLSRLTLRATGWIMGQTLMDSHLGDVEMFELYLKPSDTTDHWRIDGLGTFPHGKHRLYDASDVHCFRDSPIIYISRGKHAMYPSLQECNYYSGVYKTGIHLTAEHCSVGELYYPSTSPEFNVGDRANPNNIFETSPTILQQTVFQGEDAWESCFWGGQRYQNQSKRCRSRFRWW